MTTCPLCGSHKPIQETQLGSHCEGLPCGECGCNARNRFFYHGWNDQVAMLSRHGRIRALEVAGYGYAKLGRGHIERAARQGVDLICGDFYEQNFRAERHVDLCNLSFGDGELDLIGHSHVLEHIDADTTALAECFRCLAPGGVLLFSLPIQTDFTFAVSGEFHGDNAPVSRRNGWDLLDKLRVTGFRSHVLVPPRHTAIDATTPHRDDQHVLDDIRYRQRFGVYYERHRSLFFPACKSETAQAQRFDELWGQLELFCAVKPHVT